MTHPLATLPTEWVNPAVEGRNPIIVCQITRGVAPVFPIAEAQREADIGDASYWLIAGYPAVEAKNRAVEHALCAHKDLLLIEDDILAGADIWRAMLTKGDSVRLATTNCRNGTPNTRYHRDGSVQSSGTVMVTIPYAVLIRLPQPIFVANVYGLGTDGEMFLRGPCTNGRQSDTHLWFTIRQLDPRPEIQVVGAVDHLMHSENSATWELQKPSTWRVA